MPDLDIKLNNTLKQIIMKKIIIITLVFCVTNTFAQKETVTIITSAECVLDCCKDRIEEEMKFTKGVTAANLDIESGILSVTFKTRKTDIDKIRLAISLIGYNADTVIADAKAHEELPACCQHEYLIDPEN